MQILLIMLIVVLLAFSVLLRALAKQSPREKQTKDKEQLEVLAAYGYANSEKIRDIVAAIVPTYHSADSDLKLHKKVYEELMSEAAVAAEKN